MDIYSNEGDFIFFSAPYYAQRLLEDSITRTLHGGSSIRKGAVLTGCSNILVGRVESVASLAFVALSSALLLIGSMILTPIFIIPTTILNLGSRIPGISSNESVQNFTQSSSDAIYRALRVNFIAIPAIFLFLSASIVNIFIPGMLKSQNVFFNSIHRIVKSLGPLKTIRAVVPGSTSVIGREENPSLLDLPEEYLRALSYQNHLKEKTVPYLTHHYTYTR